MTHKQRARSTQGGRSRPRQNPPAPCGRQAERGYKSVLSVLLFSKPNCHCHVSLCQATINPQHSFPKPPPCRQAKQIRFSGSLIKLSLWTVLSLGRRHLARRAPRVKARRANDSQGRGVASQATFEGAPSPGKRQPRVDPRFRKVQLRADGRSASDSWSAVAWRLTVEVDPRLGTGDSRASKVPRQARVDPKLPSAK